MLQTESRPRISAVINTFNAEEHLAEVLESLKDFDEIVVCDMFSEDNTRKIAAQYGAKIIDHERCGICEPARNAAIQAASNPWVLIVDADEKVSPELLQTLYDIATQDDAPSAVRIPRRNWFMGREMVCLFPDYVTRFARKDKINWPAAIHSQPEIDGRVDTLRDRDYSLIHLEQNTVASRLEKTYRYSEKEVERRGPQRYSAWSFLTKPAGRFLSTYFIKGGIRDGLPGLIWSLLEAQYKFSTIARQHDAARQSKKK